MTSPKRETREQYVCVHSPPFDGRAGVTMGLQWSEGCNPNADADTARALIDSCIPGPELEAAIRAEWPGRAYWLEVGDDHTWMQVCEYGAFTGKRGA